MAVEGCFEHLFLKRFSSSQSFTMIFQFFSKIMKSIEEQNTGLQEECQSEDQASAENKENDFIAEFESMLQSYYSRQNTNNQMFSPQADSGKPPNKDSLMSQESSSFINSKLLQCLTSNVHAYPSLWNKASPEYKVGHKKKLDWINIASNLGINGKSIRKTVGCLRRMYQGISTGYCELSSLVYVHLLWFVYLCYLLWKCELSSFAYVHFLWFIYQCTCYENDLVTYIKHFRFLC